jgi:replication-associated recombination protein RarA
VVVVKDMILDLFREHIIFDIDFFRNGDEVGFENIQGYDDIKDIVRRALDAGDNYNLLFIGPPASAKTLFLEGILNMAGKKKRRSGVYFDGSNTTNRILDVLEQEGPKMICIDELDKMSRTFQNQLLTFMESGRVKVDQQRRQYDFEIKGAKVFATCNEIDRLSKPLQSRFRRLFLPRYTEEQFLNVAEKVLPRLSQSVARYIGAQVWRNQGDIRDVISTGKLVRKNDGPEAIVRIISTISKYGQQQERRRHRIVKRSVSSQHSLTKMDECLTAFVRGQSRL